MNSTNSIEDENSVEYVNYLLTLDAIPNIIITIVYLLLGIVGNSFVIYVYQWAIPLLDHKIQSPGNPTEKTKQLKLSQNFFSKVVSSVFRTVDIPTNTAVLQLSIKRRQTSMQSRDKQPAKVCKILDS
jgi:hypothetical protein